MKCKKCNSLIKDSSKIIAHLGDIYCSVDCLKKELENNQQADSYQDLYRYICHIFSIPKLDPKLLSQIKNLHANGLSYNNIMAILHYLYEIKKIRIYSPTLYYVSMYADEAKEYYLNIEVNEKKAEESITRIKTNKPITNTIIKPNYHKSSVRKSKLKIDPNLVL